MPVAVLMDAYVLDLISSCSNDPPPQQQLNLGDYAGLIGGFLNPNFQAAKAKVDAALRNHFWYKYCVCSSGSLVTPEPPPLQPPAGLTLPTGPNAASCGGGNWQGVVPLTGTCNQQQAVDISASVLPTSSQPGRMFNTGFGSIPIYAIPAGVTGIAFQTTIQDSQHCPGSSRLQFQLEQYDANGNFLSFQPPGFVGTGPLTAHAVGNLNPLARYWRFALETDCSALCGPVVGTTQIAVQAYCGGALPGNSVQPCTSDPAVLALLQQVFDLEQAIYTSLPTAIRSYAESTVHPISGTGAIGVQGATLAVKFIGTSLPIGRLDQVGANPSQLLDMGFLTPITVEGPIASARLTMTPQLLLLPALTQSVGFFLAPAVQGTLTELLRGP